MTIALTEFNPLLALDYLLVLARIGGLVVFSPFFGSRAIPAPIRVLLAVAVSFALFPVIGDQVPAVSMEVVSLVLVLIRELTIGMLLGLVVHLFMEAFRMAGQIIGFQMGFSLINIIDPQTQVQVSVLSLFENLLGMMVFLSLDAHHWLIQALVDSYRMTSPVAQVPLPSLISHLLSLSTDVFAVGFKLAAPVALVLIVVDVLLGIVGRAAPQIHILIIGIPFKPLVGFVVLSGAAYAQLPFARHYLLGLREEFYTFLQMIP